jgi:hypothetical protein
MDQYLKKAAKLNEHLYTLIQSIVQTEDETVPGYDLKFIRSKNREFDGVSDGMRFYDMDMFHSFGNSAIEVRMKDIEPPKKSDHDDFCGKCSEQKPERKREPLIFPGREKGFNYTRNISKEPNLAARTFNDGGVRKSKHICARRNTEWYVPQNF